MTQYTHPHGYEHASPQPMSPFLERFARIGYAAKGVVYCLVGVLAAAFAMGQRGEASGSRGALETLLHQPFGQILVGVIAAGLTGYAVWQIIRAISDPEHAGSDAKGSAKRVHYFFTGLVHGLLVAAAVNMLLRGARGGNEDENARGWTAWLMSYPAGQWLVGIIGLVIAGYGLRQLYRAYAIKLDKMLALGEMQPDARQWAVRISRFGIAARGVVFAIIGGFLLVAAYKQDPDEARGIGGALESLHRTGYGPWLLILVALGLIAYGVYEFVRAKYRRFA